MQNTDVEEIIRQYRGRFALYERFTFQVHNLLKNLLYKNNIKCITQFRVKPEASVRKKITNPTKSYRDPLDEITDFCGIRIIVRRLSDVAKASDVIQKEFVLDEKNSVSKGQKLEVDQFGYSSTHLVVNLRPNTEALSEWICFKGIKVEIQVQTQLQYAWFVISHPFDYKIETDIPREFRRRLFALSALFELADRELDQLANAIQDKIENYRTSFDEGNTLVEINIDSLRAYIETSNEVLYWVQRVEEITGKKPMASHDLSKSLKVAEFCGVLSIQDLDHLMKNARGWGETLLKDYYDDLVRQYHFPREKLAPSFDGIANLLMIASNADRFTNDTLKKNFGYSDSPLLKLASKDRP